MLLRRWGCPDDGFVLDPYGGVGGIHKLRELGGWTTVCVEREPEWHEQACRLYPALTGHTVLADLLSLVRLGDGMDAIVTSPAWGNRLADTYMGGSDEKAGRAPSARSRRTYSIALGRVPDEGSSCTLDFERGRGGDAYRNLHVRHLRHMATLLKPGGVVIIDIADHERKKQRQRVTDWWEMALGMTIGFVEERRCVEAARWTYGANRKRYPETLLVAVKGGAS